MSMFSLFFRTFAIVGALMLPALVSLAVYSESFDDSKFVARCVQLKGQRVNDLHSLLQDYPRRVKVFGENGRIDRVILRSKDNRQVTFIVDETAIDPSFVYYLPEPKIVDLKGLASCQIQDVQVSQGKPWRERIFDSRFWYNNNAAVRLTDKAS